MKLILVFASIVLAYLSPMYFVGDLSMPMLVECGIRSGLVVSCCRWALKDFNELIYIIFLEIALIICFAIIILEWNYRITGLDLIISEINGSAFWVEIGLLIILGGRRIGAYFRGYMYNTNPNLRGNDR